MSSILKPMTSRPAYLKCGILGFGGSGKTRTAVELACGLRAHFGLEKPIAIADTEGGADYLADLIEHRTGCAAIGAKTRSFDDLIQLSQQAASEASVLLVDSATHFWRELVEAYLRATNAHLERTAAAQRRVFVERRSMDPGDWGIVKSAWQKWTDWFVTAPLHVIVCGRAGYEYADREDDEGKTESVKVGIKMRAEGEFSYEPSLLISMERVQRLADRTVLHRATVIKDKFDNCLDGLEEDDPSFEFFRPHVERLRPPDRHVPVDTAVRTDHGEIGGDREWYRERRERTILAEEIDGELEQAHPGQTAAAKQARTEILHRVFGTYSKTSISESTHSERLRRGLAEIRNILRPTPSVLDSTDPQDQLPDFGGDEPPPPAPSPVPEAAADAHPPAHTAAAPEGETKPKRVRRKTAAAAPEPSPPTETAEPAPADQSALPLEDPSSRAGTPMANDPAEVREIELTIKALGENPEWFEVVEARVRKLHDGVDKARVWGALQDAKRDRLLAAAKAEAAARAEGGL